MQLTDTHCHIHEILAKTRHDPVRDKWLQAGQHDPDALVQAAQRADVTRLLCVGCTVEDSTLAVSFAQARRGVWASIGIHPHEAERYVDNKAALDTFAQLATQPKVQAVGECGLDFFYNHSPRGAQETILRFQLELAHSRGLPMVFHVRDAFPQFWPIFDEYPGIRGVIHSFSAGTAELEQILQRGLYVGLNGIMTFTKDPAQLAAAKAVPLDRLVLETDAPFLTPIPERGKICEPKHVRLTAAFLSTLRGEPLETIAMATTQNAQALFNFEEVV